MEQPYHSSNKIGKGMIVAGWLLIILLTAWLFDKYLERQENPNQITYTTHEGVAYSPAPLVLQANRSGHYVVTVLVNDTETTALIDTGATHVVIPEHIAKKLNLAQGVSHAVNTANGTTIAFRTLLESLQIGEFRQTQVRASITPAMHTDFILIGMNFLKNLRLEQHNRQLIISQH